MTRLRLIGLLSEAELTVSELVAILGQSQPRVSRHLKLLVEAGPRRAPARRRLGVLPARRSRRRAGARAVARVDPADPLCRRPRAAGGGARGAAQAGRGLFRRARRRLGRDPRAARAGEPGRGGDPGDGRRQADPRACSISAPAPAACSNCSRRAPTAPSASTKARRCWRWRARASIRAACATSNCARAISTRRRSSATPTISSSSTRCCISSTIPRAR